MHLHTHLVRLLFRLPLQAKALKGHTIIYEVSNFGKKTYDYEWDGQRACA